MHMMSKGDLTHEEQESCTIITASGSITTTKEATVHVKDLDMFNTVQLLKTHLTYSRFENCAKKIGVPTNGKKDNRHINPKWQDHQLQVGYLCTNGRNRSCCQDESPKRCRSIGRPRARYSRLPSTVHGRTGRKKIWFIQQCC